MTRLTNPSVTVDPTAARFMGPEVKIQDIGDKLLHLILNGPTINSINKDTLRHLVRQLYDELSIYENTGLTREQILEMYGEMKTAYDESSVPYMVEATGIQAKRFIDREIADIQGRLFITPAKPGDVVYWVLPDDIIPEGFYVSSGDKIAEVGSKGFFVYDSIDGILFDGKHETDNLYYCPWEEIGKTCFLTKEEAEAALVKMKEAQK